MMQENKQTNNSLSAEISAETDISAIDGDVEPAPADTPPIANTYEGWKTFESRIEGVSFKYPATMSVQEVLPTDKNDQGQAATFTTISLMSEGQDGNDFLVFRISDTPWGCVGPGVWELTYDVTIGDQATTLNESCAGLVATVMLNSYPDKATLVANTQYVLEDKGDFDLILASMAGVGVDQ